MADPKAKRLKRVHVPASRNPLDMLSTQNRVVAEILMLEHNQWVTVEWIMARCDLTKRQIYNSIRNMCDLWGFKISSREKNSRYRLENIPTLDDLINKIRSRASRIEVIYDEVDKTLIAWGYWNEAIRRVL